MEPWSGPHTGLLVELSSDPRVVRHIGTGELWSAALAEEVSQDQRRHWEEHGFGWRACVEKASGEAVGLAALNLLGAGAIGLEATEIEIGWWLKPSVWGRGFAVEGGEAMLAEAFGRLEAPSVVARIQPSNEHSVAVAQALGFIHELTTTGRHRETVEVFRLFAVNYKRRD